MRVLRLIGFIIIAVLAVTSVSAETVDEIIAKHLEARGGREALAAVKTARVKGTLSVSGMNLPYTLEWKRPNKVRRAIRVQGNDSLEGFDGSEGWARSPHPGSEPTRLTGGDLDRIMVQTEFIDGELANFGSKGYSVELVGRVVADGRDAFELKVTRPNESTTNVFLDMEHFLIFRREAKVSMGKSTADVVYHIGDYKRVGGIVLPHSIEAFIGAESSGSHGSQGRQLIVFDSITLNVGIDDQRFEMP